MTKTILQPDELTDTGDVIQSKWRLRTAKAEINPLIGNSRTIHQERGDSWSFFIHKLLILNTKK